jgi:hypothetical protein
MAYCALALLELLLRAVSPQAAGGTSGRCQRGGGVLTWQLVVLAVHCVPCIRSLSFPGPCFLRPMCLCVTTSARFDSSSQV